MLKARYGLVLQLLIAPALFAQDFPTYSTEPERRKQTQDQAEKAAEEARKRRGLEAGAEVTYEQVLADPDNVDLNYSYARTQVEKGNLRSAAATLERILMVKPDLPRVRLFYAVILFRLDNIDDAERELGTLKSQKMPESLRAEIDEYMREIRKRRRRTRFGVLLGAGLDFDDNRNAAPASGQRLLADVPVILDSNSTRKADFSKIMMANLSPSYDLGYQAGHQIFASLNYYRAEQTHQRTLNLQSYSAEGGLVYKSPWADVIPSFGFSHLLLAETTYLRQETTKLRLSRGLGLRLAANAEASYARQRYNRTQVVPNADQRNGDKIEAGFGLEYLLTPSMRVSFGYTHTNQGAREKFNAFQRESFTVGHNWLLGRGMFMLSSLTANLDRYQEPELAISANKRRDNTWRARATYGTALGFIGLKDAVLTLSYEYFSSYSPRITNYAYTNNKVSSLLTYKWEI